MTIPCRTCERPGSCISDRRCNRPRTLDVALKEWAAAIDALNAASNRLSDASKAVQTAWALEYPATSEPQSLKPQGEM